MVAVGEELDGGNSGRPDKKTRALISLYFQHEQFAQSMDAVRDLALHADSSDAVRDSPKLAFREAVRIWNKTDSDDIIDEVFIETMKDYVPQLRDFFEQVENGKVLDSDISPMSLVDPILREKVKLLSKLDSEMWNWYFSWNKAIRRTSRKEALFSALLVSTASAFEVLVGDVLRCFFHVIPQSMGESEKQYSFADVARFDTLDAFERSCIEDRIENIMRGDVSSWFEWIEKRYRTKFSDVTQHSVDIIEAFLRRNLVVHNAGLINNIYLSKSPRKVDDEGVRLSVDKEYVLSTIDKMQVAGSALTINTNA